MMLLGLIVVSALASQALSSTPGSGVPRVILDAETTGRFAAPAPPLEIEPLVVSGASSNRVNLVFFSDGYVAGERDKFFGDVLRLAQDVSGNQTFNTVKPLLNIWGAFTASNESGIGVGGVPRNTIYGLYRDGTELRAVYYSKPEVASAACSSMGNQCDYPILLGNDPLYGGLGGTFTVITSSLDNGPLILRHELGHSIIGIGEEYDGGFAYFGPNSAQNLSKLVPWTQWLTEPGTPRVERSVMPFQAYPWTLLNTTTPWSLNFSSSGQYSRYLVQFSLSGLPVADDLRVELDGIDLEWVPREDIGVDRWFYEVRRDEALIGGSHELKFTLLNQERQGSAQLCSAEILEFGNENEFHAEPGYYGAYPTFSDTNETTYRPTNDECPMRMVTYPNFCSACLEGLWLSLLRRVHLIDNVTESCQHVGRQLVKTLSAELVPLAQFRKTDVQSKESYTITWSKDGHVLDHFANQTSIQVEDRSAEGNYTVKVKFATAEVRVDKEGLLNAVANYTVTERCSD